MDSPLVSILMPAFNAERYIAKAIHSALQQEYPCWELIVVNDGSTDGTEKILSTVGDERVRVFQQANGGEAAARNTALQHASGEYIAFLDADDEFLPDHLERVARHFAAHPETDGVYTDGYYVNEQGQRLKPLSARRRGPFEGDIFEPMVRASDVFGAPLCVTLRRALIRERQITFDPAITIGPDWDFLTACSQWAKFGRIDEKTCLYRVHTTNISLQTKKQKRLASLARCREKAIRMERFHQCSVETREFVFYDLLVNLLQGQPARREEILRWEEFSALPRKSRARLLRQAAVQEMIENPASAFAAGWLRRSRSHAPADPRSLALALLYPLFPGLCRGIVSAKQRPPAAGEENPFGDLFAGK